MRQLMDQRHPHLMLELLGGRAGTLVGTAIDRHFIRRGHAIRVAAVEMRCAFIEAKDLVRGEIVFRERALARFVFDDDSQILNETLYLRRE